LKGASNVFRTENVLAPDHFVPDIEGRDKVGLQAGKVTTNDGKAMSSKVTPPQRRDETLSAPKDGTSPGDSKQLGLHHFFEGQMPRKPHACPKHLPFKKTSPASSRP
jgi:hypothetical protein